MKAQLIKSIKESAEEINEVNPEYGFYAMRKANSVNENTSLENLIKTAEDLVLIAEKIQNN
jgi:hypothetical protein